MATAHRWETRTAALACAFVLLVSVLTVAPASISGASQADRDFIFDETNEHRGTECLPALRESSVMNEVAQDWAEAMAAANDLSHNPNVGSEIYPGWQMWGENVAWNTYSDAVDYLMTQWKESPGHNANMLSNQWTHMGVGVYESSNGRTWGVQVFAKYPGYSALDPATGTQFCDVLSDHPFLDEIEWLADEGIASGYSDFTFRPKSQVTRQAMAAFLYRLAGEPAHNAGSTPEFSDVPTSHAFYKEIDWLVSEGITTGYPGGVFKPSGTVSRQAVAAFLYRLAGEPAFTPSSSPTFTDVPTSQPFFHEIEWMVDAGITGGYSDNTFRPGGSVTRQAIAAFVYRYDAEFGS